MKKFLLYLFFAYVALSVQGIFFESVKPDFVLVLVCFYALKYGHVKGVAYGALSGLIIDAASGFILGPNIISKSVAAFLARSVRENIFNWNIVTNTLVIAILSVVDILIVYICHKTFTGISFLNRPWRTSLLEIVLTTVAAFILYGFFNPEKDDVLTDGN